MDALDLFHTLQFQDEDILHEEIRPVTTVQADLFILDRQGTLKLEGDPLKPQFVGQALPRGASILALDLKRGEPLLHIQSHDSKGRQIPSFSLFPLTPLRSLFVWASSHYFIFKLLIMNTITSRSSCVLPALRDEIFLRF